MFQVGGFILDQPSSPAMSSKGKGKEIVEEDSESEELWDNYGDEAEYSAIFDENPSLLDASM